MSGRGIITKPAKFKNYLTTGEVAAKLNITPRWLRSLERQDRIPIPARLSVTTTYSIRLYSPAQVKEIQTILAGHRRGRPRKEAQ